MPGGVKVKRYLFINHWAGRLGGAELSLADILDCMVRRAEVHLLTTEEGPLTEAARHRGVFCHVFTTRHPIDGLRRSGMLLSALASWRGLISFALFIAKAVALVRNLSPVLIHANVPKSHVTLLVIRLFGCSVTGCFHVREIFKPRSLPLLLYRILWNRQRGHIISISQAVHDHLPARLRVSSKVIHNGIKIPSNPLPLPGLPPVRFLYLGRMVPWKGCHLIIESFRRLLKMRPGVEVNLTLVGDTIYWNQTYRVALERAIHHHGLSSFCSIRGHAADPYAEIESHHVLCMASYLEPFGRTAAEAHACGRAVVAFEGGGIGEVVENGATGILVPYGDIQKFAEAMAIFTDDLSCITRFGIAGYERTKRLFNRERQIPVICDSLEAMAETGRDL